MNATLARLVAVPTRLFASIDPGETRRLRGHALAILLVGIAVSAKQIFVAQIGSSSFTLFYAAIAAVALAGGLSSAWLAMLLAVLAARTIDGASLSASLWFGAEASMIAAIVAHLRGRIDQLRAWLADTDADVRNLRAQARHARMVMHAFDDLERASGQHVVMVLAADGTIRDWRAGAGRQYLVDAAAAVGTTARLLFDPELTLEEFDRLLQQARANGAAVVRGAQRRADGTRFDAEVQLRCVSYTTECAFIMLVHDLTDRQAAEAFERHATARQHELRAEISSAQQQLATLEMVTDPHLNALPGREAITTLLERLRDVVNADGIAIVRRAGARPRLFWASEGLRPEPSIARSSFDAAGRTVLIHNDPARVAEMSMTRWPDSVGSMIAVPLLQGGLTHATMEVVYQRGTRSTDWEIALIQVTAARAASLLPDEPYQGAGAVA